MVQASYSDLLLTAIVLLLLVLTTLLVVLGMQISRTLRGVDDLRREAMPLVPRLYEATREAEASLRSLRQLSSRADHIGQEIEDVAIRARCVANPLLDQLESTTRTAQHIAALIAGIRAALGALQHPAAASTEREDTDE